jgi:hygromycin-B 7''-O-kinase
MTFPLLRDAEDWPALHAQPLRVWTPALSALGRAWGLDGEWVRLPGGEDSVVFAQGGTVVKLVPPFLAADAERDVSLLRRVDLPVPSPRVEDVRHEEGWTAVRMTRLAGAPADRVWLDVPHGDRVRILSVVGALLRAIWSTPVRDEDGDAATLLARLRIRARRHEADGFADVGAFLERNLPRPSPAPALIHFDLNDGNLMLDRRPGRWEVSGVLDFVASRAFHPPMDLVTPGLFFCRGDPSLLRALLEAAGAGDLEADELAAWHLLHPFSNLPRDLAMGGQAHPPSARSLRALWST